MKIALIGTVVSSTFNFRLDLICTLVSAGHQVYVFCTDYDEVTRKKIIEYGAHPVDYPLSRSGMNPFADLATIYVLRQKFCLIKPDVVFSTFVKPVIYGSVAARLANVSSCFAMLEGLGYAFTDLAGGLNVKQKIVKYLQVLLYRLALPCIDNLIFLNHDDPVDLLERNKLKVKKFSVLGGIGIDLSAYPLSDPPSGFISFIFVGRLLAEKGIFEYVEAAKIIKQQYPEVKFVVLGEPDEANPGSLTKKQFYALRDVGLFICPGYVEDVSSWVSGSSVFVLPSYREGFPRSTQEAMSIGRAVITTDVPGCRETVIDGLNGFLVAKSDHMDLAKKMLYFIEKPEEIVRMGAESRRIAVERFGSEDVNRRLMEILECD